MSLLFTVLVVLVIGGIAVVAAGGGDVAMSEAGVDSPDVRLPAGRPLTGADLREVRFGTAVRGYRAGDVDALLERLARELDAKGGVADKPARAPYEEPPSPR